MCRWFACTQYTSMYWFRVGHRLEICQKIYTTGFWLSPCLSLSLCGSLWLSLALCDSHSGSRWLYLALTVSLPVSLWLSMAPCNSHSGSLWLSQALTGSYWITPCLSLALYCSLWLPFWFPLALTATLWLTLALSGSKLLSNFAYTVLDRPLLGSQRRCHAESLYPGLLLCVVGSRETIRVGKCSVCVWCLPLSSISYH